MQYHKIQEKNLGACPGHRFFSGLGLCSRYASCFAPFGPPSAVVSAHPVLRLASVPVRPMPVGRAGRHCAPAHPPSPLAQETTPCTPHACLSS